MCVWLLHTRTALGKVFNRTWARVISRNIRVSGESAPIARAMMSERHIYTLVWSRRTPSQQSPNCEHSRAQTNKLKKNPTANMLCGCSFIIIGRLLFARAVLCINDHTRALQRLHTHSPRAYHDYHHHHYGGEYTHTFGQGVRVARARADDGQWVHQSIRLGPLSARRHGTCSVGCINIIIMR